MGGKIGAPLAGDLLGHYLSQKGGNKTFNAEKYVLFTANGLENFIYNLECLQKACEEMAKDGKTCYIVSTVNSTTHSPFTSFQMSANMDIWQILNTNIRSIFYGIDNAEAMMFAECTRNGKEYEMNLRYYVQDYYDFDIDDEDEIVGDIRICDMAQLHYYGYARNFKVEGVTELKGMKWTVK